MITACGDRRYKMNSRTIKLSRGDRAFLLSNDLILILSFILVAYPLIYIISASFSSPHATITGKVWLYPVEPSLEGYKAVFRNRDILNGYMNTIFYTVVGTAINVVITVCAAYPLSRRDLRTRNPIMFFFGFTMFFSGGMIPTYILLKQLGMINTPYVMIIPGALSVYNMIITRTFFQSNLSSELLEAAKIDGCSDIKFLIKIAIPLSKAVIAVITLFYAVEHWNAFFNALLYLSSKKLMPLQIVLREILVENTIGADMRNNVNLEEMIAKEGLAELLKYSLIIVASLPVLIIYPFIQKYFVKGVMLGSIKG